jgi:hypothetical protein
MKNPLDVVTDNSGRVSYFTSAAFPDTAVLPEHVGEYLNGAKSSWPKPPRRSRHSHAEFV